MIINLNDMLYAFSYALDCVEHDLLGVTTNHGKRVAYMAVEIGRRLGISDEELTDLAGCAVLHDNALTEFIQEEFQRDNLKDIKNGTIPLMRHCVIGEDNVRYMPFRTDVRNIVLYHHENADGSGPFELKTAETPIKAQLIHLADTIDAQWNLSYMNEKKYHEMCKWIKSQENKLFSSECVDAAGDVMTLQFIQEMQLNRIDILVRESLSSQKSDYSNKELKNIAALFAKIVDYKSKFTRTHSIGVAEKAEIMSRYYGYDEDKCAQMYFAGALHDIGKLVVDRDVLEKPDKLTSEEYKHIQDHAYCTYAILSRIDGLGAVTNWASLHHEKLNGKGYPFGRTGEQLSKEERLMGCIDIYQALTEDRPYKKGMNHEKTISILRDMAENNFVDIELVNDLDKVFRP